MIVDQLYVIRKKVDWIHIYWNQSAADWTSMGNASVYDFDGADDRVRMIKSDCIVVRLSDVAMIG
jgi:hypothetical protein